MKNYEYKIRTDLAVQNKILKNTRTYVEDNIVVKKFYNEGLNFTNIIFNNINLEKTKDILKNVLIRELKKYLKKYKLNKFASCLIVGLGNKAIASDSLGPETIEKVVATGYISNLKINTKIRSVYTYVPGVMKDTGYASFRSVKALVEELQPDFVIVIDALISGSVEYLNKLIQLADVGIVPGSGICNYQEEISEKTIGKPVFTIGVPTAIEAATIIKDALNIKEDTIKYQEGYDLIVSSKDINYFIKEISSIIGKSLNECLNTFNIY